MATQHVSEANVKIGALGGITFGVDQALLVSGDLTSLATAKSNVDTDNAKLHVSQRLFGTRVKASLDIIDNYQSGFTSGSDATAADSLASRVSKYRTLRF